jgi:1,4-alpha-glucan branching enzyme
MGAAEKVRKDPDKGEIERIVNGTHAGPHGFLGAHSVGAGRVAVRVWRPDSTAVTVLVDGAEHEATQVDPAGLWSVELKAKDVPAYRVRVQYGDAVYELDDPYRFWPTIGDLDIHLFAEGRHEQLWRALGARPMTHQGVAGTAFTVWAPNARAVRVVGDFTSWDGRILPMRMLGSSGIWELFVPGVGPGRYYKFEILDANGSLRLKADPMARATEPPPGQASIVSGSEYEWRDDDWLAQRAERDLLAQPMSTYEVHLGSWRTVPEEGDRPLTYNELATQLVDYVADLGFTHVELLPVTEHPYTPSWGYQVSSYFAPTARYGTPDDFRRLVDAFHQRGIGVIIDWVPAHFPKDDWALARFDGTALYEHADPRQGEHPDWGTYVFNFGRNEVRNFLRASALYWLDEMHVDGVRVDAVASMLYLDYSRKEGEWVPNQFGGRENLEAVSFLKEATTVIHGSFPGALTIAEESTAWPAVSRPTYVGGLGFSHKWNMGWMHDTLEYFSKDPIHRRYHHDELTFSLVYAFTEQFVLPLSHDEVVHGKGSLLAKMPGDDWQKHANLRALYGYMWAHPGKKLLFMGGELAQEQEWSHTRSLDWHLTEEPRHAGVQRLVRDLNHVYRDHPQLWELDNEPSGFRWLVVDDRDANVVAFARFSAHGAAMVAVANMSPVPRPAYRLPLPHGGRWREILNTDAEIYGGANLGNLGVVHAEEKPWGGESASVELMLPPLGVIWLSPDE